jgi:hypothetical protein
VSGEAQDIDQQYAQIQAQIADIEDAPAAVLRTRLARAHPWHITRVARAVFGVLSLVCVALLVMALALPVLLPDAALFMADVDRTLPVPFPFLAGLLALCMTMAWITAGQAALAFARDCPMLPWEEENLAKLRAQLDLAQGGTGVYVGPESDGPPPLQMPQARLAGGERQIRVPRPGSPTWEAPESGFVAPVPTPGGTLQYESARPSPASPKVPSVDSWESTADPFSGGGTPLNPGVLSGTPRPAGSFGTPAPAGSRPGSGVGTPRPASATPAGLVARKGAPPSALAYRAPDFGTPAPVGPAPPPSGGPGPSLRPGSEPILYSRRAGDGYTTMNEAVPDMVTGDPEGPGQRPTRFAAVDEPWLVDALRKADQLSRRYPIQAFLEYSVEPDLPFTLVLERATPAMSMRAMVEFVGFLASIATPRRARIELRSVVHLDRSFYRSVSSAMEPYFPDSVEVKQQGYRVELTFLEPDRNWGRYPILPMEG